MRLGEPTELLAAYKAALESGATQSSGSSALAIDASKAMRIRAARLCPTCNDIDQFCANPDFATKV